MSLAIALLAVAQNAVGASVAWAFGEPASLAVFLGSAAFLGGHGTTAAWAGQELAASAANAFEVGMACATLGLVAGGVLGSVVATRLLDRAAHAPGAGTADGAGARRSRAAQRQGRRDASACGPRPTAGCASCWC